MKKCRSIYADFYECSQLRKEPERFVSLFQSVFPAIPVNGPFCIGDYSVTFLIQSPAFEIRLCIKKDSKVVLADILIFPGKEKTDWILMLREFKKIFGAKKFFNMEFDRGSLNQPIEEQIENLKSKSAD